MQYVIKILVTAVLVVLVSEIAERYKLIGALVASLPIVSIGAMIWMHADGKSAADIAKLSSGIFWLVIPSLILFALLPYLLVKRQVAFPLAMTLGCCATALGYGAMVFVLGRVGVKL
ncbi:MAG: DUF3147 family protein [Planctomycetes bacterium]|nr:DUF3147 family protein [Planctomycetota bacterium]